MLSFLVLPFWGHATKGGPRIQWTFHLLALPVLTLQTGLIPPNSGEDKILKSCSCFSSGSASASLLDKTLTERLTWGSSRASPLLSHLPWLILSHCRKLPPRDCLKCSLLHKDLQWLLTAPPHISVPMLHCMITVLTGIWDSWHFILECFHFLSEEPSNNNAYGMLTVYTMC